MSFTHKTRQSMGSTELSLQYLKESEAEAKGFSSCMQWCVSICRWAGETQAGHDESRDELLTSLGMTKSDFRSAKLLRSYVYGHPDCLLIWIFHLRCLEQDPCSVVINIVHCWKTNACFVPRWLVTISFSNACWASCIADLLCPSLTTYC